MARHPSFRDATIAEAVRLVEETGPLDDAQAMREALAVPADAGNRIVERARVLGRRIGLAEEWERGCAWAPWVLLGLVALIVIAGLALAGNVLGGEARRINVVVALTSLLGLHLLTLLLWLLGLLLPLGSFQFSFGWIWAALTARVAGGRRGQAPLLLRAMSRLLARARLLPWALGLASHSIWALSFAVVLAAMLFALAFRSYQLTWETTILDPDFFLASVQLLGRAPAWLGFPVPDREAVLSPLAAASAQRAWALWLTGCLVVYGLLPRLFFALLCAGVCRARRGELGLDLSQPYYRRLQARFEAMAPRQIIDADPGQMPLGADRVDPAGLSALSGVAEQADELVAVAFELPEEFPWPPPGAEFAAARALRVDGSAAARRELLELLARTRPRQVLVGCRASASPDRGTERFLRDAAALAGRCRLLLVDASGKETSEAAAHSRWRAWLADTGLHELLLEDRSTAVLNAAP